MKTVRQIADESGVHRVTINKAIERGVFPAQKSGDIWLIDETTNAFTTWLYSRKRPKFPVTILVETPEAPEWVKQSPSALERWESDLNWRIRACDCGDDPAWRKILLHEAERDV